MKKTLIRTLAICLLVSLLPLSSNALGANVGDKIPHEISSQKANGAIINYTNFSGEKGLAIIFIRSVDWCPFCKKQIKEWSKNYKKLNEAGYKAIAVTYDSLKEVNKFTKRYKVKFPVVSDTESQIINAFGILNEEPKKGSRFYGIPHPHIYVVNNEGIISHKFTEEGYKDRPEIDIIFDALK